MDTSKNLSERIRPGIEAAPWVVDEVREIEAQKEDWRVYAVEAGAQNVKLRTEVATLTRQRDELLAALENTRHWFEAERKSISKGNGSQWSMWQCDEQMESIDAAIARVKESK